MDRFEPYRLAQVRFLIRQLDIALRFARSARTYYDSVPRLRSLALARKSHDFIFEMSHHIHLTTGEASTIVLKLDELQREIAAGEGEAIPG